VRLRVLAVTLVAMVSGAVIAHACTDAEQNRLRDELPRLMSWQAVYASFKAYTPRCDDGWMAEGYTDAVVKMLAHRWASIGELGRLGRRDPAFEAFVLRHVDGSADLDELRAVFSNATRRCPGELHALCRSLATAATEALKG